MAVVGNVLSSPRRRESEIGLSLFARGSGIVHTDVASNVIHHVSGCDCGFRTALVVGSTANATLAVGIVNNTVADVGIDPSAPARGILVRSPASANGFVTARVYNNVLAGVFDLGILLEAAPRLAVIGDRNDIVRVPGGNDFGSYDMGTTLALEPHFKSAGSYRLSATSPLADAAVSCPLGGVVPRSDAAGRFRYSGPGLDLGAYERGSTAKGTAAGVSRTGSNAPNQLVGTNGRDVLCGLGGNDRLTGRGGADFLFAGLGRDRALGGAGNDRIDLRDGKKGNDSG